MQTVMPVWTEIVFSDCPDLDNDITVTASSFIVTIRKTQQQNSTVTKTKEKIARLARDDVITLGLLEKSRQQTAFACTNSIAKTSE